MSGASEVAQTPRPSEMPTVGEAVERLGEFKARQLKHESQALHWLMMMRRHCSRIWETPVDGLLRSEVLDALGALQHKPPTMKKVRIGLRQAINLAMGRNEAIRANPAGEAIDFEVKLMHGKYKHRHHHSLPHSEVGRLLADLGLRPTADAVRLVALTAVRSGEAGGAKWEEFELDAGVWTIPAVRRKSNELLRVPLSRQALQVLRGARVRSLALASPWAFPQEREPIANHATPSEIRREVKAAGYDTTVHGLRSSFKAWALEMQVPREVSEFALGHRVGSAVERAYSHGTDLLDRRREVMQFWGDYLLPADAPNVVEPARKRGGGVVESAAQARGL